MTSLNEMPPLRKLGFTRVGFTFEVIIQIRALAARPAEEGCCEVGGDEERAPAFALPHVDAFVSAGEFQQFAIACDHDVSQRHCGCPAFQWRASRQNEPDEAAVDFQDAVADLRPSSGRPCERRHS
jgi:hypothetical protein